MMDLTKLSAIKVFIDECKSDPSLLSSPSLAFFREYLESLGANPPKAAYEEEEEEDKDTKAKRFVEEESEDDVEGTEEPNSKPEEDEEQSLIVEMENVDLQGETVEPDYDPTKKERDLSDENREAAQELKGKAMDCVSEGKFYKSVQHLTRAIAMSPTSAILYANRASVYIKLRNPNAAFRDAVTALEINPDSAKGYKARGMARAMLGDWAEAEKDLHLASMIDYDEEISDVLKEIEERWRQHRHAEPQAAYDKAKKQEQSSSSRQDAKKQERSSSARQKVKKQGHSSSKKHMQEARRQEQSSSSRQSRGDFPGSLPGMFPDGFLGGFPGSFPPGDDQHDQSGFLGGSPFGSFRSFGSLFGYQN